MTGINSVNQILDMTRIKFKSFKTVRCFVFFVVLRFAKTQPKHVTRSQKP